MPMNLDSKKIVSLIIASKGKPGNEEIKSSDEPETDSNLAGRDAAKRFMETVKGDDAEASWKAFLSLHKVACEVVESEEEPEEEESKDEEKTKMEY